MASRSICMSFLCIHQSILLIHKPQFQDIRVRAFGDCDQTSYPSKGSSGPSTAQSHDPSTLIAETRCAPLTRPLRVTITAHPAIIQNVGTVSIFSSIPSHHMNNPSLKLVIDAQLAKTAQRRDPNKPLFHYFYQITLSPSHATLETSFFQPNRPSSIQIQQRS